MNSKISFRLVYKTEYTHIHLFICIYRYYLFVCPPIVPFPTPHYPIPLLQPPPVCSFVTMSLHSLSLRSLCLPFLCYHVFYILCPLCHSGFCLFVTLSLHTQPLMSLCHYVFRSSVTMSLHTQSLMSLCHSGFCSLCTFWLHKCKVFLLTSYFVGK